MTYFAAIVPVYQTPSILKLFLDSLYSTITMDTDIFFINDGSGDRVQCMLSDFSKEASTLDLKVNVSIFEHKVSLGTVFSINSVLKILGSTYDFVVLLDSDIILRGSWQENL